MRTECLRDEEPMIIRRALACALSAISALAIPEFRESSPLQPHESGRGRIYLVLTTGIVLGFIVILFGPQLVAEWSAQ
jgi:hypothetical protein